MDRRRFLTSSGTALATALAGCSSEDDDPDDGSGDTGDGSTESSPDDDPAPAPDGNGDEDENEPDDSDGQEETDADEEDSEPDDNEEVSSPAPQSFSGSGATVERDVSIDGGLTVIEADHDGESNFQVSLEDDSEFGEMFVNEIGEYAGETAALVDGGEYLLDVEADGDWNIELRQPRAASGDDLPQSLSGGQPTVLGPFDFTGTHVASGSHSGESNFQVTVFPAEGSFGELVFNEIGDYEGETSFRFSDVGWVAVQADGEWSVDLE